MALSSDRGPWFAALEGDRVFFYDPPPPPPRCNAPEPSLPDSAFDGYLPELERQLAICEERAVNLRRIIAGVRLFKGEAVPERLAGRPHGLTRDGFLRVMDEAPHRIWKLGEIRSRLLEANVAPSSKAVDAVARRLLETGVVVSPRYGFYAYPETGAADSQPGSGAT